MMKTRDELYRCLMSRLSVREAREQTHVEQAHLPVADDDASSDQDIRREFDQRMGEFERRDPKLASAPLTR